jgi:hypothetical protein
MNTNENIHHIICIQKWVRRFIVLNNIYKIKQLLNSPIKYVIKNINPQFYNKKLLTMIKCIEKNNKNRKSIISTIDKLINAINNTGKKAGNGTDETIRINWIVEQINNNTDIGIDMKNKYYTKFNKNILKVEIAGKKKDHYDILIYNDDDSIYKCEEKGSKHFCEVINPNTKPYEHSVEFYNGPISKFTISNKYLKIWYDENVDNPEFKTLYNLPDISFDDWKKGGPLCIMDPTSDYSISLKKKYRDKWGDKTSMNAWKHNNPIDYRTIPNTKFILSEENKKILIREVQEIYNYIMNEKDIWLQTSGWTNKQFSYCWYNKINPKNIIDVELIKKKDIIFKFILEDNTSFTGIMRWGKGCGFSCFRMDFK